MDLGRQGTSRWSPPKDATAILPLRFGTHVPMHEFHPVLFHPDVRPYRYGLRPGDLGKLGKFRFPHRSPPIVDGQVQACRSNATRSRRACSALGVGQQKGRRPRLLYRQTAKGSGEGTGTRKEIHSPQQVPNKAVLGPAAGEAPGSAIRPRTATVVPGKGRSPLLWRFKAVLNAGNGQAVRAYHGKTIQNLQTGANCAKVINSFSTTNSPDQ